MDLEIVFDEETKGNRVYLDGQDVTDLIRRPEVNAYVSLVSSHKKVRDFIVALQKEIARRGCIVMDGRDIGTVVMPDADWKIFLHASVEERARRRLRNCGAMGTMLISRNWRSRSASGITSIPRAISPLRKAEDAVEVDTTHLNIEEVVARVLAIIKGKHRMYMVLRAIAPDATPALRAGGLGVGACPQAGRGHYCRNSYHHDGSCGHRRCCAQARSFHGQSGAV